MWRQMDLEIYEPSKYCLQWSVGSFLDMFESGYEKMVRDQSFTVC